VLLTGGACGLFVATAPRAAAAGERGRSAFVGPRFGAKEWHGISEPGPRAGLRSDGDVVGDHPIDRRHGRGAVRGGQRARARLRGPPLHIHPHAEESYAVVSGTLDVCGGGEGGARAGGESVTAPAGTAHTLKNQGGAEVRLVNVPRPALAFERFFRRLHALACSGKVKFPPKGLRSAILVSMLFREHSREVISVRPSRRVMKALALVGRILGYKLPP